MPLPFILGAGAAIAGVAGIKKGVQGIAQVKEANDTMENTRARNQKNMDKFNKQSSSTNKKMDELGKLELDILHSFDAFADTIEQIQDRPDFKTYNKDGVSLPKYNPENIKNVAVGAGVLLGGLSGAAIGTAGGFAAAGATTSAVMALGTASTGTAIASLSGAAATNAALAALGGGAIGSSAFAGGMALGSTILGATTLGVGLLVGGLIFNVTGNKLSEQADEAYAQMKANEEIIKKACSYLFDLECVASQYTTSLNVVHLQYLENFKHISYWVNNLHKVNWEVDFTDQERLIIENAVLLVNLLYQMCKVNLVIKSNNEDEMNTINRVGVNKNIEYSKKVLKDIA